MIRAQKAIVCLILLPLFLLTGEAIGQAPNPLKYRVDKSLFRKAYGVLANEQLMFPVDMSDWPIKIDRTHQLFVDEYMIASRKNVTRQVHQLRKHPRNPLISPDKPWEGSGCVYHRVLWDEEKKRFRMWYHGYVGRVKLPSGARGRSPTCYAESKDGLTWTKPVQGLHAFQGSKANNIVILAGGLDVIFHEPHDPNPAKRYKALVWLDLKDPKGAPPEGFYLYSSPDGIHWKQDLADPVVLNQNRTQSGIGDTTLWRWDSRLRKYIGDTKILFRRLGTMRCRGMMESDDLIHWTRPRMTFYPDGLDAPDTQIYGHMGFVYESMWIGLIRVMRTKRVADSRKQTVIQLTASRDGRHWTRVGRREEVLALGKTDDWDPHYHDPCTPPIRVRDESWFYYRSVPLFDLKKRPDTKGRKIHRIGLAMLRPDGFVSMNAGEKPGTLITRPLTTEGTRLFVNAEVAEGGYIKAELRDASGKAVGPYVVDKCTPVTGNTLKAQVTWAGGRTVQRPAGKSLRVVFRMKKAKLYSFWLD